MSELSELERRLAAITEERNTLVQNAHATISRANREFDRQVLPISRRITELKAQQEKAKPPVRHEPKTRQRETPDFTGWDQADIDLYRQLTEG